jgi:hypothetical protein
MLLNKEITASKNFQKDGILVSNWGTFGTDAGEFYTPVCITVDHDVFCL